MRIFTLILIFSCNLSFGQVLQNGLIIPKENDQSDSYGIYFPKEGFALFDKPNGEKIGILTSSAESYSGGQTTSEVFFLNNSSKKEKSIDMWSLFQIDYEIWAINYIERKNGFVRIIDTSLNFWVSENEIVEKKFVITEWQKFLIDNSGNVLGYYANDPGLFLRDKPSVEGKILKKLKGDLYEITPYNESVGLWTKVKIKKYKEHPCSSNLNETENVEFEIVGWIKIVDDSGVPNLWFYARGC